VTGHPAHWDRVYGEKQDVDTSWHQPVPVESLTMLDRLGVGPRDAVIDVGGGTSTLVDQLLARGHRDVTVLDVAPTALERTRGRLGERAAEVDWVVADVTAWRPTRRYDVWHDRAVLHFLTTQPRRAGYLRALRAALPEGGAVVVATFAEDGPDQCSGLPVVRYSGPALAALLGPDFAPVCVERVEHLTPWGAPQPFTWLAARRAGDPRRTT